MTLTRAQRDKTKQRRLAHTCPASIENNTRFSEELKIVSMNKSVFRLQSPI